MFPSLITYNPIQELYLGDLLIICIYYFIYTFYTSIRVCVFPNTILGFTPSSHKTHTKHTKNSKLELIYCFKRSHLTKIITYDISCVLTYYTRVLVNFSPSPSIFDFGSLGLMWGVPGLYVGRKGVKWKRCHFEEYVRHTMSTQDILCMDTNPNF